MTITEFSGFIFGIIGVYLTIKENIWCFPIGLISVIISLYLFTEQKLYSDAIQQIVYIILLAYAWYKWLKGIKGKELPVTGMSSGLIAGTLIGIFITALSMGYFFSVYSDAQVPYLDALATAISFAAQWLVAKKKIENWVLWIVVNILYIGIYMYKDLYLYAVLFAIYLVLAIFGYIKWKKELQKNMYV